ncbi:MAG: hypothetical protein GY820_39605 [Gammaproteobacteria bacterium]|nr:hypothetical protein [Gammaproteobacteria bacterium]
MANLPDASRVIVSEKIEELWSREFTPCSISKQELKAAVDAIDVLMDQSATSVNNAFPPAAKAGLTTAQKAVVLMYVTARRYIDG